MNYSHNYSCDIVQLEHLGTIAVMEWIRANEYPNLDRTVFSDSSSITSAIVSFMTDVESNVRMCDIWDWHEVEPGMKRMCGYLSGTWYINVDDHIYFMSV